MVPEAYHDFYVAAAGVSGALIGLLFVAVSVHPDQIGEHSDVTVRFRPTAALSAFLNALLVSLLMLVPLTTPADGVVALAVVGLAAMLTLTAGVLLAWRREGTRRGVRSLAAILGQLILYAVELYRGVEWVRRPAAAGPQNSVCIVLIILFVVGIERAWEFVGAESPGPLTMVARGLRARRSTPGNPEAAAGPEV